MSEKDDHLKKFYEVVEQEMAKRMMEVDEKIKISLEMGDIATLTDLLIEANGLISLASGEDEDLYEIWRYRLFYDSETDEMHVIQGEEIDVDIRMWSYGDNETDEFEDDIEDEDDDGNDEPWGRIS